MRSPRDASAGDDRSGKPKAVMTAPSVDEMDDLFDDEAGWLSQRSGVPCYTTGSK